MKTLLVVMLFPLLPLIGKSQCYEDRLAFNFNVGTPFQSGAELSFFPKDGRIGFDAGFYLYQQTERTEKITTVQPMADPIGRIIYRLNQYGDFQHQVTVFATPKLVGVSYRLYYRIGDVMVGIEPTAATREFGVNALVTFDL
jgi:hypothetical protein